MRWFLVICIVPCLALVSCRQPPLVKAQNDVVVALSSRQKVMEQSRTLLGFAAGEARSCQSYAELRGKPLLESISNQLAKSEYLLCDVLLAVTGQSVVEPLQETGDNAAELASRLDFRSFPSSLGPRVGDTSLVLNKLFPGAIQLTHNEALAQSEDWSFRLQLVAIADVDGNGHNDWLVWVADEARNGNYRSYFTLLIRDVPSSGLLQAEVL